MQSPTQEAHPSGKLYFTELERIQPVDLIKRCNICYV